MNKTILIVDDLSDWRNTLFGILSDAGYTAYTAGTAEDAIKILKEHSIDLLILDIRLDEADQDNVDGLLLAAEARRQWPQTRVIIFTGYSSLDTVRASFEQYKVADYLYKSEVETLLQKIEKYVL